MAKKKRKKPGLPPGSLIYTGQKLIARPNVSLIQYNAQTFIQKPLHDQLPEAEPGDLVSWYDLRGLNNVPLIEATGRRFGIHPLALEDILNTDHRPKLEEYDEGFILILKWLTWNAEQRLIHTEQVALYTSDRLVISFQEDQTDLFASVRDRLERATGKIRQRGADYLTYALSDLIIDHYYAVLDQMEEAIENIEANILGQNGSTSKGEIHQLKLATLRLRKVIIPTRDAIYRLWRLEHSAFREETALFVRDLHDHIVQVAESAETNRDMITGVYDLYLSEINLRTNNIVRILTIISTIFIPLTFLVGVYGMNFEYMPELDWRYGYYYIWAIMLLVSLLLVLYFRQRKWL